jgi:hypothetical protein
VVLLVLAIIYGFIELHKKEYFTGLTLIIVPGLVLFIPGYLITIVFLLGFNSFNEDCIVYQNGDEKIIIQYYNPGAVGTSHTRIIITDSPLTANLRPFNEIKLPAYKNIDFTDEGQPNCDKIPNEITYRNEKYKLVFCKK